jgi:hypothetical protein
LIAFWLTVRGVQSESNSIIIHLSYSISFPLIPDEASGSCNKIFFVLFFAVAIAAITWLLLWLFGWDSGEYSVRCGVEDDSSASADEEPDSSDDDEEMSMGSTYTTSNKSQSGPMQLARSFRNC